MTSLLDLGEDIVCSNICLYLSANEIFKLSLTCKQLHEYLTSNDTFHRLFLSKFGSITPLNLKDYDWEKLFKLRSSKKVNFYTWGAADQGRLGYLMRDVPQDRKTSFMFGVHTPTKLNNFENFVIEQISCGGYSFQVLSEGKLYCVGARYCGDRGEVVSPGPALADYGAPIESVVALTIPFPMMPRFTSPGMRLGRRGPDQPALRQPPEELTFPPGLSRPEVNETQFVTKMELPNPETLKYITQISSGRLHVLALDNFSNMYTWDSGNSDWRTGVQLKLTGLHGRVTKIHAGWSSSVCLVLGVGLVYWCGREPISEESFERGELESEAIYHVIPDLNMCVDFIALRDCVLYVSADESLMHFPINRGREETEEGEFTGSIPLEGFNKWLSKFNVKNKIESSFTKLTGSYNSFVVFTDHELVLYGKGEDLEAMSPTVIPHLQNNGVIHVVTGDYHFLALTDKGELLSWGRESQSRGCLGLGDLSGYSEEEVLTDNRDKTVNRPMNVLKPTSGGRWLAVTAGGWQSGGLFVSD